MSENTNKPQFHVVVSLEDVGVFNTFFEALKVFVEKIMEISKNGIALQVLETTNFIILKQFNQEISIDVYQAGYLGHKFQLLTPEGKIVEDASKPNHQDVTQAFRECFNASIKGYLQEMNHVLGK